MNRWSLIWWPSNPSLHGGRAKLAKEWQNYEWQIALSASAREEWIQTAIDNPWVEIRRRERKERQNDKTMIGQNEDTLEHCTSVNGELSSSRTAVQNVHAQYINYTIPVWYSKALCQSLCVKAMHILSNNVIPDISYIGCTSPYWHFCCVTSLYNSSPMLTCGTHLLFDCSYEALVSCQRHSL